MHPDKKSQRVGGILQNNFPTSAVPRNTGQRNTFRYEVANFEVCKEFSQFVFCVSKKPIQRLQDCINSGQDFSGKKKGNNNVPKEELY